MSRYRCQSNFQMTACMAAVRKIQNAMFSQPKEATPKASTGASPAAIPGAPIKLPGLNQALIHPTRQAKATVANPTLIG